MLDQLPPDVLPELVDFLDFLRFRAGRETPGHRVKEAIRLYVGGEISLGRAAELAGMNYFLFEELLREQRISADVTSFAQMELIMDNLLNREEEPEDAVLAASTVLQQLVAQARQEPPSADWERELDEL